MAKIILNDPHRAELAAAIADSETARKRLDVARAAASNAESQMYAAMGKLEDARALAPENGTASPDRLLEEIAAAGEGYDVQVPGDAARRAEAKIEEDIASWRRAHVIATQAIPGRQAAVDGAMREVAEVARAVISKSLDVAQLLAEAEIAASAIVEQRTKLMHIRKFIEDGDDHKAIDNFLARPWLIHEHNGDWQNHPAGAHYRDAHAALMRDADAPLPA